MKSEMSNSQSWPLPAYISLSGIVFRSNGFNLSPFRSISCCRTVHFCTVLSTLFNGYRGQRCAFQRSINTEYTAKTQRDEMWTSYHLAWTCFCARFWDSWYPEIGALAFSLSCATATAVLLGCYNNKPAPELSLGITPNAVISILATASKVSLIFAISH